MQKENYLLTYSVFGHLLTLIIGFAISLVALPEELSGAMPNFALLILLSWTIRYGHTSFYTYAFFLGLLGDIYTGQYLGVSSLIYTLAISVVSAIRQQIIHYPLLHQAAAIGVLVLSMKLILFILLGISNDTKLISYWLEPVTTLLVWPLIVFTVSVINFKMR